MCYSADVGRNLRLDFLPNIRADWQFHSTWFSYRKPLGFSIVILPVNSSWIYPASSVSFAEDPLIWVLAKCLLSLALVELWLNVGRSERRSILGGTSSSAQCRVLMRRG